MPARISEKVARAIMVSAKLKPLEPYRNSTTGWKCKCLVCQKVVKVELQKVKYLNRKCPECGKARSKKSKLHSKEFAFNKMLKAGWRPLSGYDGKNNKSLWKSECIKCGEISEPQLGNVIAGRSHCGYCKKNKVNPKKAISEMKSSGLIPVIKYPGAGRPWKSKCNKCSRFVYPRYADVKIGIGCEYCSGRKLDLKIVKATMKKAKLKPLSPFPGTGVPWSCLCLKCKKKVTPRYANISSGGGGCIYCMKRSINYSDPALLYLISHPIYQSIKVGITGTTSKKLRLNHHRKFGWQVFETIKFETGKDAENVETEILRWLRVEKKLGVHLSREFMPQGGHTETIDASEIDLPTIWAKVEQLSKVK